MLKILTHSKKQYFTKYIKHRFTLGSRVVFRKRKRSARLVQPISIRVQVEFGYKLFISHIIVVGHVRYIVKIKRSVCMT